MPNYTLTFIGSASGLPEPDRAHSSLALHRRKEIILLDAGEGTCSSLIRWGFNPLQVKKIFITHTHPDHCVGLFMLLQYMHMQGHRGRVEIYIPKGTINTFQQFMNQLYLVPKYINPDYRLHLLKAQHKTEKWTLDTFPTQHLQRWQDAALPGLVTQSYALRFTRGGRSVFYSSDIAELADIAEVVQPDDLLVLEGAHIEVERVIEWALEKGLKQIILTHYLPDAEWLDSPLFAKARRKGTQITLARDGLSLEL